MCEVRLNQNYGDVLSEQPTTKDALVWIDANNYRLKTTGAGYIVVVKRPARTK